MTDETWTCGDCGTDYPMTVDFCEKPGLDAAYLHLYPEPRREIRRNYPIYLAVAEDLNIQPPVPPDRTVGPKWLYREGDATWWAA